MNKCLAMVVLAFSCAVNYAVADGYISKYEVIDVKVSKIYYEPLNSKTDSHSVLFGLVSNQSRGNLLINNVCPSGLYTQDPRAISLMSMIWISDTTADVGFDENCQISRIKTLD